MTRHLFFIGFFPNVSVNQYESWIPTAQPLPSVIRFMQAVDAARTQAERSFTQGSEKGLLEKTRKDLKTARWCGISRQSWWRNIFACWWIMVYWRTPHMWPNSDQTDVATSIYQLCHSQKDGQMGHTNKWPDDRPFCAYLVTIFRGNSQMVTQLECRKRGLTGSTFFIQAFRKFELLSRVLNGAVSHSHHMRIDTGADVHLHGICPAEA